MEVLNKRKWKYNLYRYYFLPDQTRLITYYYYVVSQNEITFREERKKKNVML